MIKDQDIDDSDVTNEGLSSSERLKIDYAKVINALYRDMKAFCTPGVESGVEEVAELIDRSANTLRHQFGPTCYDHAPTAFGLLQMIESLASRAAVEEIAALADCVVIPKPLKAARVQAPSSDAEAFALLAQHTNTRLAATIARLKQGRALTQAERAQARDALHDLITYAAHLLTRLN